MNNFNFEEHLNEMRTWNKIDWLLKSNHYIIGKFTLMDLTILPLVFFGVGYALERATDLSPWLTALIPGLLCVVIEYYRIKWRRVKTLRYAEQKAEQARTLMNLWIEVARQQGDEATLEQALQLKQQMDNAEAMLHEVSELAYEEDVLGLSEEDE